MFIISMFVFSNIITINAQTRFRKKIDENKGYKSIMIKVKDFGVQIP